jgi:hypothetical protein
VKTKRGGVRKFREERQTDYGRKNSFAEEVPLGRGLIQRVPGALVLEAKVVKVNDFPT